MEKIRTNPENFQDEYIKNLNIAFDGWGGKKEYDWVFNRKVGNHSSDILLIENEEDGVIAGSGISYRILSDAKRTVEIEIGIMTGSWTLPAARRKGCFTKIINSSKELCSKKEVPFLTAFVTDTNPSSRRLRSEGSYMFPTYHLFSPIAPFKDNNLTAKAIDHNEEVYRSIYDRAREQQAKFLNFSYDFPEFVGQYLERIKPTTILKINEDYAILEDGVNESKVLLLTYGDKESLKLNMEKVTNWSLKHKDQRTFFFSTRKEVAEVGEQLEFENLPGYFTILSSSDEETAYRESFKNLNINMADKM